MVRRAFPLRVVVSLAIALAVVGGVVAAGAALRHDDTGGATNAADQASGPTSSTSTTSTLPPTTTTTLPVMLQPPPTVLPPLPPGGFGPGAHDPAIQAYEQRMVDVKIDPGLVDGVFDQAMVYGLQAVEKLGNLPRTGRLGDGEKYVLENFQFVPPYHPTAEPNRTEIDVVRQVITLYENYQVKLIVTTSTASGVTYCYNTPKRAPTQRICEVATTPSGRYQFYLFRSGWDNGDLGALFNPYYFDHGRAIHGYAEVPPEPASHGCARIPMNVSQYFHTLVQDGEAVYVDGGQPEHVISSTRI